ncbi:hypothetical protein EMPG_16197 [Blastomyces silverae]|uniref:Uncharacterized protein n=1 Tax=Blastomyces silverae TaxID=2060906 RepID=A0A0H1BGT0_9EURO|nr:hypothetical protein EMPG_16197 [Blastomyces silverae]
MRDGQPLVSSSRHFYPLLHDTSSSPSPSTTRSRVVSQGLTPMNIEAIRRARAHQQDTRGGRNNGGREVSERKQVGDAVSLVSGAEGREEPTGMSTVPRSFSSAPLLSPVLGTPHMW